MNLFFYAHLCCFCLLLLTHTKKKGSQNSQNYANLNEIAKQQEEEKEKLVNFKFLFISI